MVGLLHGFQHAQSLSCFDFMVWWEITEFHFLSFLPVSREGSSNFSGVVKHPQLCSGGCRSKYMQMRKDLHNQSAFRWRCQSITPWMHMRWSAARQKVFWLKLWINRVMLQTGGCKEQPGVKGSKDEHPVFLFVNYHFISRLPVSRVLNKELEETF